MRCAGTTKDGWKTLFYGLFNSISFMKPWEGMIMTGCEQSNPIYCLKKNLPPTGLEPCPLA